MSTRKVLMRGLPFRASPDDIREFFKSEAGNPAALLNITDFQFGMNPDGRSNGECTLEFATDIDVEKAMQFDRQNLGSRYVELKRVYPTPPMPVPVPRAPAAEGAEGGEAEKPAADRDRGDRKDRDRGDRDRDRERKRSRHRSTTPPPNPLSADTGFPARERPK
ncbi:hypothetical protein T484DRAFT_1748497 [Baffinella frigidus]|nr:hypothetical protein T484DRAFT_1748497 [Cryptophyta sp. CCMP2293]